MFNLLDDPARDPLGVRPDQDLFIVGNPWCEKCQCRHSVVLDCDAVREADAKAFHDLVMRGAEASTPRVLTSDEGERAVEALQKAADELEAAQERLGGSPAVRRPLEDIQAVVDRIDDALRQLGLPRR